MTEHELHTPCKKPAVYPRGDLATKPGAPPGVPPGVLPAVSPGAPLGKRRSGDVPLRKKEQRWTQGDPPGDEAFFAPLAIRRNNRAAAAQNRKHQGIKRVKDAFRVLCLTGKLRDAHGALFKRRADAAAIYFDQHLTTAQQNYFGRKDADAATRRESAINTLCRAIRGLQVNGPGLEGEPAREKSVSALTPSRLCVPALRWDGL